ncbi:sugar transporter SWEET1-like [Hydractinia symbiolongicarpus]|uniref:sugar transporter SWEET1-like n=1 Tax=Hydractinia symbiolongicarpus TaxID=13093 RepID=UPI00254B43BB|nr:sugar transporter SWEET1-like [Hydractinia symbiolongicarpus]
MVYYEWSLKDVVGSLAVIASFLIYAAGSKTCYNIIRRKTTGDVTLFPFIASLYCGVIWLKYGLLTNLFNLTLASGVNTICQIIFIIVYYIYSLDRRKCNRLLMLSIPTLYAVLFYIKYVTTKPEAIIYLGLIGSATSILMSGSPLVSLVEVIKLKSTQSLDFGFIVANALSAFLWSLFGFLVHDMNVFIPNGIGFLLTAVQLSLFKLYPSNIKELVLPTENDLSNI